MITAVDSSVLLDIVFADPRFGPASHVAMTDSLASGSVVACPVVWAEVSAAFEHGPQFSDFMDVLGIDLDPIDAESALAAGRVWRSYRAGGGPRTTVIADFLIGAHALTRADRLLTRDRGFLSDFDGLTVVDPTSPP